MSCGKKEKEIIFRQLDPKYYEELERTRKELEETKKIKARDGVDGKDGRDCEKVDSCKRVGPFPTATPVPRDKRL
ncbi:MAG: hypothetical protein LBJ98_02435 [Endomicrobium sp.]|jgi:hypothetical protein|nr:hypothetical protein [Endomicrobium sp.]